MILAVELEVTMLLGHDMVGNKLLDQARLGLESCISRSRLPSPGKALVTSGLPLRRSPIVGGCRTRPFVMMCGAKDTRNGDFRYLGKYVYCTSLTCHGHLSIHRCISDPPRHTDVIPLRPLQRANHRPRISKTTWPSSQYLPSGAVELR